MDWAGVTRAVAVAGPERPAARNRANGIVST
jgi:hypothetical protein